MKLLIIIIWEWVSNFILHFTVRVIIYPWWDLSLTILVKGPLDTYYTCIDDGNDAAHDDGGPGGESGHWKDKYSQYDDVIKWKNFPRYWPFVRGIHRSRWIPRTKATDAELCCFLWSAPEPTAKQAIGTPDDLKRHRAHYGVFVTRLKASQNIFLKETSI